jgi:hypothetical protein
MKVAVLNPDLIPDFVDVVIGDYVYELQFRVENMPDGEPQVIDMDSIIDGDEAPKEKEPENMDLDGTKIDESPANQAPENKTNTSGVPGGQHKKVDTGILAEMDMTTSVAGVDHQKKILVASGSNPVREENSVKPVVLLTQTGMTQNGTTHWKGKALSAGTVPPVRASKRNVPTSDQDSLEKATKLKARKNMDSASLKGNGIQPQSFNFADDSYLLASTGALGISLGVNEQEISASLLSLKDLESRRLAENIALETHNRALDDASTVCSGDENLDLESLNLICADIADDLGDGGCDPSCLQTPVSQIKKSRSKRNKSKKNHSR